ncbi:MAG: bifunctional indole-3-glycerol-phosphate synthase TrpC/phosphoribosylanthranilate isomerase TrpF [Acidobacteriota bacterium]|nr:bifunctional indole-3-glycerol-phosphate synthase TrpC/phosphoribosylanthranilate isomerase TrpF [Acidobacteriota bacterium]
MALDRILSQKRAEVAFAKREHPVSRLLEGLHRTDRGFAGTIGREHTGFVLECKRRSPSEGTIREDLDPEGVTLAYSPFADAISVVTDGRFFGGSLLDLRRSRACTHLPVLRKDFILEPYQVVEARASGADAVLLMLSVLDDAVWRACSVAAAECGMDVLTEVHTREELERALALGARIIGINTRDLETMRIDLGIVEELAPRVPPERLVVVESGIQSHADVAALRRHADAFLVGTSLMREPDLDHAIRRLVFGDVKVCGLARPKDARAAWNAGATWGGLVFAAESPRYIDVDAAHDVREAAPLWWAGVFVNERPERIGAIARTLELAAVQLHGEEEPGAIAAVRDAIPDGCEIWKAVRVRDGGSVPRLSETGADRLLLDAFDPRARGGTGASFEWAVASRHPDRRELVMAGGLDPRNAVIADAVGVGMLDVNSGVEDAPGIKNRDRLDAFFAALRGTGRER